MLYGVLLSGAGNNYIHLMTSDKRQRLRIDMTDWSGNKMYIAEYDDFKLGSAQQKYQLVSLGVYTGNISK